MLVYFSEDLFHKWGRRGRIVRQTARKVGHICISVYPASIIQLTVSVAISIFVPTPLQLTYWFLVIYFLFVLTLWFVESITGIRGMVERLLQPLYLSAKRFAGKIKDLAKKVRSMRLDSRRDLSKQTSME